MGVASASFPSKNAVQFHDLVDHMVSTLNLPEVLVKETFHLVSDILSAAAKNRISLTILDGLLSWPNLCGPILPLVNSSLRRRTKYTRYLLKGSLITISTQSPIHW